LAAKIEPFNNKSMCWSWVNNDIYNMSIDSKGVNLLSEEKEAWFSIVELEVWSIE